MNKEIQKDFYITSDTWFGRPQILQIANRAFNNIEEMNSVLIKNWNKKVKKTDVVQNHFPFSNQNALSRLAQLNSQNI